MGYLIVDDEIIYEIAPNSVLNIGRLDTNDIILDDYKVSREHAILKFSKSEIMLVDLASTHGSYVNDARIDRSLINYGERYRAGEHISSSIVESTVNTVISKRFAKKQQMQWSKRGAHLLLQARTRTLDGTLRPMFERWYPGMANDNVAQEKNVNVA